QKGSTPTEKMLIDSLPEVLSTTKLLMSSINIASTKAGINLNAVGKTGRTIKRISEVDPLGNAKLVVFANAVEDNPFMAGAFHGVSEDDAVINVGVSGPGVVKRALETVRDRSIDVVAEKIKTTAFKITRIGQLIGGLTAKKLGLPFGIVDLSLAPTPARGDSVAEVLEEIGLEQVGTHGTTAALMLLNDAIKKGGVMASQRVGGLSGAFIPVSEDAGMIDATVAGTLSISKLEAMTSVCSVGLDMIAIPGNTPASTISAMIADEAAIGVQNNKTTAVRVIPVPGKSVGDSIDFGGLLGRAPIMPVIEKSSTAFINRGGHIPAPIHSFKN
ncbi:PFL family protein, partial [Oenococcus oeni]